MIDPKSRVTEKRWTFERIGSHGNSKSVLRFTAPAEVKGVALLIVNHPDRSSDQWMWTPAIERDRRCIPALAELDAAFPGKLRVIEGDATEIDARALLRAYVMWSCMWRCRARAGPVPDRLGSHQEREAH